MKKIFMAALTLVMAVFASCTNEDLNVENNDVKVNFTVAEKVGFGADSRAVKSGWANNDEILIVFQTQDKSWLDFSNNKNFITLTKTDEGWTVDYSECPEISSLSNGKEFLAIHHPGNMEFGDKNGVGNGTYLSTYQSGYEYLSYQGVYTISGSEILLGTINMSRPSSSFQISVKITDGTENSDYTMGIISKTNDLALIQCFSNLFVMPGTNSSQFSGNDGYQANYVTIENDKVFNFRGYRSDSEIKSISVKRTNGTFYYNLDEKKISDLQGKAWILPELKINGSNDVEEGCQWIKATTEE